MIIRKKAMNSIKKNNELSLLKEGSKENVRTSRERTIDSKIIVIFEKKRWILRKLGCLTNFDLPDIDFLIVFYIFLALVFKN